MPRRHRKRRRRLADTFAPLLTLGSAGLFIGLVLWAWHSRSFERPITVRYFLVGVCVSAVPSLVASYYADQTARYLEQICNNQYPED